MGTGCSEKVKYFKIYDVEVISLPDGFNDRDVFNIRKSDSGIEFDSLEGATDIMSKEDAIAALQEAIDWIKNGEEKKQPAPTPTQKAAS